MVIWPIFCYMYFTFGLQPAVFIFFSSCETFHELSSHVVHNFTGQYNYCNLL